MTRGILGTILWACLAACIGVGLFFIKHEVKDQEHHLNELNAEIQRNQESLHVLRAEWSYLNDPARLRELSEKHLGMHPVMPAQVATLDSILRNGLPGGTMLAASRPAAVAPSPVSPVMAHPAEPPPPLPPPPRPEGRALARAAPPAGGVSPPGPAALAQLHPASTATTPAHGGRSAMVAAPALAQRDGREP